MVRDFRKILKELKMDAIKALHEWKKGGRGETMMSTFEYKSSHDKMFIEGFRMAEMYYNSNSAKELKNGRVEKVENGTN